MFWKQLDVDKLIEDINHRFSFRDEHRAVLEKRLNKVEDQLRLILKELGKEYLPEKSVTEPAKLVDKQHTQNVGIFADYLDVMKAKLENEPKPKKKRGRPKGSKNKKTNKK